MPLSFFRYRHFYGKNHVLKNHVLKDTAIGRGRRKLPLRGTQNGLIVSQPHEVVGSRRPRPIAVRFNAWSKNAWSKNAWSKNA